MELNYHFHYTLQTVCSSGAGRKSKLNDIAKWEINLLRKEYLLVRANLNIGYTKSGKATLYFLKFLNKGRDNYFYFL